MTEKNPDRRNKNQLQAKPSCDAGLWNELRPQMWEARYLTIRYFTKFCTRAVTVPLMNTLMDTGR